MRSATLGCRAVAAVSILLVAGVAAADDDDLGEVAAPEPGAAQPAQAPPDEPQAPRFSSTAATSALRVDPNVTTNQVDQNVWSPIPPPAGSRPAPPTGTYGEARRLGW